MGLFGSKKEGGFMDVIRCDKPTEEYLIWKWSPDGQPSRKENSIRYGSTLCVKNGQAAIFVYKQKNGNMLDIITTPCNETLKTANFPVLTGIVGSAFGGASPFQAEVYYLNTGLITKSFFIDEFKLTDCEFPRFSIPAKAKGSIQFKITNIEEFINEHHLNTLDLDDFWIPIKDKIIPSLKTTITQVAMQIRIPLEQIQSALEDIALMVTQKIEKKFQEEYKVNLIAVNVSAVLLDEESDGYQRLMHATAGRDSRKVESGISNFEKNMDANQKIFATHLDESLRIQREEAQRAQSLESESNHLTAHQLNIQGAVGVTAAESLGNLGGGMSFGDGGGMNPAGMMTGMMMGGAVGGTMSNMMGNMMQGVSQPQPPAPPAGALAEWHISSNGQQAGPYTKEQIRQMITAGNVNKETYVWKAGMTGWEQAANVAEIATLFGAVPPPPPPCPQTPPAPPTF